MSSFEQMNSPIKKKSSKNSNHVLQNQPSLSLDKFSIARGKGNTSEDMLNQSCFSKFFTSNINDKLKLENLTVIFIFFKKKKIFKYYRVSFHIFLVVFQGFLKLRGISFIKKWWIISLPYQGQESIYLLNFKR